MLALETKQPGGKLPPHWEPRGGGSVYVGVWTGLGWPRIETGGGRL